MSNALKQKALNQSVLDNQKVEQLKREERGEKEESQGIVKETPMREKAAKMQQKQQELRKMERDRKRDLLAQKVSERREQWLNGVKNNAEFQSCKWN